MHLRYVTIPKLATISIPVRDDAKGVIERRDVPVTFEQIVLDVWSVHPSFGKGLPNIDASIRIRAAFRGKSPGDLVVLDEDAWTRLATVVQAEDSGLLAPLAIALRENSPDYFDCVLCAPTTRPSSSS